jgi:hypothetical protein
MGHSRQKSSQAEACATKGGAKYFLGTSETAGPEMMIFEEDEVTSVDKWGVTFGE